jgi:hypothetical protein
MYQPNAAFTLTEVANNLKGVLPQSPTLSITPESCVLREVAVSRVVRLAPDGE